MAKVGAQRAAELTGKSKSTIQRSMKNGKLSYEVDAHGRRLIDVSELDRAFGLMKQESEAADDNSAQAELEKAANMLEMERMKMKIKMLEDQLGTANDQISDLKEQREQWQKQAQQVLLTSQYSQKQAEELKEEMKERDRRARERRQQEIERRTRHAATGAGNENRQEGPMERMRKTQGATMKDLWQKIRGAHTTTKKSA